MRQITIISGILFLLLGNYSEARNYNRRVTFAIQSGLTNSKFAGNVNSRRLIGNSNNISLRFGRKKFLQIGGEFSIFRNELDIINTANDTKITNFINFSYVNFLICYGYRLALNKEESIALRFYGGLETSLLIWAKDNLNNYNRLNTKSLNWNISGSMGLDWKRWMLDFRIQQGILNAITDKTRWNVYSVTTGLKF